MIPIMKDGQNDRVKHLDPRSLRALAHPLRMELLRFLRAEGPATATQLARRLSESSGSTSYHLRQLAAHGFVEEERGRGTGRERWWRSAHRGTYLSVSELLGDPDTRGALDIFLHEVLRTHFRHAAAWLAEQASWTLAWVEASTISDYMLRLSPAELLALSRELHDTIERYRRADEAGPEDAERVIVQLHAFPQRAPERSGRDHGEGHRAGVGQA